MPDMVSGGTHPILGQAHSRTSAIEVATSSAVVSDTALELSLPTSEFSSATAHSYQYCEVRYLNEISMKASWGHPKRPN